MSSLGGNPDHRPRLHISHVCHRWREIALNLPLLWSHVNFTSLSSAGAAETLARAKLAPLSLEANISTRTGHRWDNDRFNAFRKELEACVPHIRHLMTSAVPVRFHRILERLVSPAPTLEYLSLHSRGGCWTKRMARHFIPDTLFDSSTPKLSHLELRDCNISWRSPLLKGLRYLKILSPSEDARPELTVWLDALDEMPQLTTLTLHSASPIAPPFPLDVKRTVTLRSLMRLDIFASPEDCALTLAHLDLPALTLLYLTIFSSLISGSKLEQLLPFVVRHAHGLQDTLPLQSALIRIEYDHVDFLAWPVLDIDVEVHDPPTLLAATLPARVALSFISNFSYNSKYALEVLDTVMTGLPLDGLVMLAAHDLGSRNRDEPDLLTRPFWLHCAPRWPLLQRVRLEPVAARGFIAMLLEDNGGREKPVLPSLTQLFVVDFSKYSPLLPRLYDALKKRLELGVPVEMLDLRMYRQHPDGRSENWLRLLSEIVVDVFCPEEIFAEREQLASMWNKVLAHGPFVDNDNYTVDSLSTGSDDYEDDEE